MKKILALLFVSMLSVNWTFAYTQDELDIKKDAYTQGIISKIWDKIDALSYENAARIVDLIDDKIEGKYEWEYMSEDELNTFSLLLSLRDVIINRTMIDHASEWFVEETIVTAQSGDMVSVHYTLTLEDWMKLDSSLDRWEPFAFTIGQWHVIKWWDEGLVWREVWEKFNLVIAPEEWYWIYDETKTETVARSELVSFTDAWIELVVWAKLPTQFWEFEIIWVEEDSIIIDINHHLAWETLYFEIEVIEIEK